MIIRNYTPFQPFYFETEDHDAELFSTFLLKGTFEIIPGQALKPCQEQLPLAMGDEHFNEPTDSSVKVESDLCPLKSGADLIVTGNAIAPNNSPTDAWDVAIRISGSWGEHEKRIRVTGPRYWQRNLFGWSLSKPEPTTEVPLTYENSYGGRCLLEDGAEIRHEQNPYGKGFLPKAFRNETDIDLFPAPQIESHGQPISRIDDEHFPEGFGPICRAWKSRTDLAGTYDQAWLDDSWPHLPEDFDFGCYRAAHPDLQLPQYLNGDESMELFGMHTEGVLSFTLPKYQCACFFTDSSGEVSGNVMDLDTLHVDSSSLTASLVWRIATPRIEGIKEIEPRMLINGEPPRVR